MPDLRPFRALRFDASSVGDCRCRRRAALRRHRRRDAFAVWSSATPPTSSGSTSRWRRSATNPTTAIDEPRKTLAAWRSDGTLRKDPHPSIYVYEQTYRVPGTDIERTQRGFFARLKLEAFEPDGGVLPHERTLTAPKEDRYKLLRATGVNTSPVVGLFDDAGGRTGELLAAVAAGPPDADVVDDDGVRHRLWALPASGDGPASVVAGELLAAGERGPITIADGHHRYETALRYRDERRMTRSCEEDPPFDYLLALLLEATGQPLTVLPTHRVVRGIGAGGAATLLERTSELFTVEPVDSSAALVARVRTRRGRRRRAVGSGCGRAVAARS